MKRLATLLLATTLLAACAVEGPNEEDRFSCADDTDCIAPNVCCDGTCYPVGQGGCGAQCEDEDGDGYGVGDIDSRTNCPLCQSEGECDEDCDDDDESVNHGATDVCDGVDNDCDGEVDEPTDCETGADCPPDGDLITSCDGTCTYGPPLQATPECQVTLSCVDGERETPPPACQ